MQYAYNEEGKLVNGVILFFEKGDDEIATETFKIISTAKQSPTGIDWNGYSFTPLEVLQRLGQRNSLNEGHLGVRFTVYEDQLLKSWLDFLRENYPALSSLADEIDSKLLGTRH